MPTAAAELMRPSLLMFVLGSAALACATPERDEPDETAVDDAEIVGGSRDLRWSASGYLLRGSSMETLDRKKPACGATLIAPNVAVTAAHCVLDESATFAFGTGGGTQYLNGYESAYGYRDFLRKEIASAAAAVR